MDSNSLWTVATVITVTCIVVSQIKMWLGNAKYLRAVPLIVVALAVSVGVTLLAHAAGYLSGTVSQLVAQTILAALGSGGLYNVINGSSTQRLDETASHPTTRGNNAVLVGEVQLTDDDPHDHHGVTPLAPLALVALMFLAGCGGKGSPTAVLSDPNATQNAKLYAAKQLYLSSLEFFTFLRDQHVVTQQWVNSQKGIFDDVQLAYKIWEQTVRDGGDVKSAEERFNAAAAVLRKLREQYQSPSTQPAAKVDEYDDRGYHRACGVSGGVGCYAHAGAA
jgi:uncharacterized lipoprotein YmbA